MLVADFWASFLFLLYRHFCVWTHFVFIHLYNASMELYCFIFLSICLCICFVVCLRLCAMLLDFWLFVMYPVSRYLSFSFSKSVLFAFFFFIFVHIYSCIVQVDTNKRACQQSTRVWKDMKAKPDNLADNTLLVQGGVFGSKRTGLSF